ncbi:MAG: hypothetical protein J6D21_11180 [Clostridia bacterium]|nr:hypothetical protein [Clostridia bacterium]
MKKITVFLALLMLIIVVVCVSCGESFGHIADTTPALSNTPRKELISVHDYEVLLYATGAGESHTGNISRYQGEELEAYTWTQKSNRSSVKKVTLFGNEYNVHYSRSMILDNYANELDRYSRVVGMTGLSIMWDSVTEKIVHYSVTPANNRDYNSPVNPNSTEEAFLDYVKKVFIGCTGISLEGWDVRVTTYREEYGTQAGFINYSHETPEYNAQYTFVFYKTIGGIERNDAMYITVTNVGEIVQLRAINYEKAFEPFGDVVINRTKVEEALLAAFQQEFGGRVTSEHIAELCLVVKDDVLWAKATIEYSTGRAKGGVIYVVKVAELKSEEFSDQLQ